MIKSLKNPERRPIHPGAILREDVLPGVGMNPTNFATHLGISKTLMTGLLGEKKSLTVDMALRISKAVGGSADSWLSMQLALDLWEAENYFKNNPDDTPKSLRKKFI